MKFWYKEKTPVSFNNVLTTHPFFIKNYKLIPTTYGILNDILHKNQIDEGSSEIWWRSFHKKLGVFTTETLDCLKELELLQFDHKYITKKDSTNGEGHCIKYLCTDKCHKLLADSNQEYFYKLMTDRVLRRKVQKSKSDRGYNKLKYNDIRDVIKETNDGIGYEVFDIQGVVNQFSNEKRAYTYSLLIQIYEGKYWELHFNKKDGRVCNPYTLLPSEVRRVIKINGNPLQRIIDIVSCYPSLWGQFMVYIQLTFPTSPIMSTCKRTNEVLKELGRYNHIFLNGQIDPKDYLSKLLGIKRSEIKEILISYYNGRGFIKNVFNGDRLKKAYRIYDKWLRTNFPLLYSIWLTTDISQTGNNIGKHFETKLMLDNSIYQKGKELGIDIGYEYDGMSFYSKDDSRTNELVEFIEKKSVELLGIKVIFVDKDLKPIITPPEEETISLEKLLYESNISQINTKLSKSKDKWDYWRRKIYSKRWIPNDKEWVEAWNHYKEYKKLKREEFVLEYNYEIHNE